MSAYLVLGNISHYGKAFRSETEISSARGSVDRKKLLNCVFICQSYNTAILVDEVYEMKVSQSFIFSI